MFHEKNFVHTFHQLESGLWYNIGHLIGPRKIPGIGIGLASGREKKTEDNF